MKTGHLAKYAPTARRAFIAAVTARAAAFGLTAKGVAPMTEQGDMVLIGDRPFPRSVADIRRKLEQRIKQQSFAQAMEATAYTWFNRLVAIRYMELHGYLDHGRGVLSHPAKPGGFEILDACTEIELPGLDRKQVLELKLDGNKDEELYRLLLLGQCRALHQAMPFLFEAIEDETELLLPGNLTKTDSLIRRMVDDIPEEDWQQVEIVGWLYQFYISEKKDQVIGKVVKSEDIPAATQLFTPNWIVKYMVQNSLGAQWLATYPNSPLRQQMDYYIEPAEQTEEVQAQLKAITPTSLDPEQLTLMDPACGSGHILVEAYDLFKAIYLERGYRQRDIPKLILKKNLYGLEIDPRAAQLTGFALMMKGRADDRRLFERGIKLNVMALQDSTNFDPERVAQGVNLADYGLKLSDLNELKRLFERATTFGSLIQVPEGIAEKIPALKELSGATSQDLFVSEALKGFGPLVRQAELLAAKYDAAVANPPYMSSRTGMTGALKKFARTLYPAGKPDLFSCFIERGGLLARDAGRIALLTRQSWMFMSSWNSLREKLLTEKTLVSMAHLGSGAFGSISGDVVQTTAFVLANRDPLSSTPTIARLVDGGEEEKRRALGDPQKRFHHLSQRILQQLPGSPLAYWVGEGFVRVFLESEPLGSIADARQGLSTSDNEAFLRRWHEVEIEELGIGYGSRTEAHDGTRTWFPYNKGGAFRKWYGNQDFVIKFDRPSYLALKQQGNRCPSEEYYFRESVSWSDITSETNAFRTYPTGFIHDGIGHSAFAGDAEWKASLLAYCNGKFLQQAARVLSPGLHFDVGYFNRLPFAKKAWNQRSAWFGKTAIAVATHDWNAYERSWDFQSLPLLSASSEPTPTLEASYTAWIIQNRDTIAEMKCLEEENNRLFIDAYGLADELTPDVPIEQITLTVNPAYRYGGKLTEEEQWTRFRQDTMQELVSYAIGCMMGRYSLDAPGLIYAHCGNEGFDPSRYSAFPADDDGIVPLTDTEWFDDDAAHRLIEFISVAWDKSNLEANLTFLADHLSARRNESSRDTLRRYLCDSFFKDHLQTYKNRPIYWLFSSGKHKAFQCLVYLHRYNEGTLARMRTEYVIPLQGLIASRIERLDADILAASSTAHRKRLEKGKYKLVKQRAELQKFDEKLRHYADQRIKLDLDDGVKVNYGKFGDLLAEVKKVTGEKAET